MDYNQEEINQMSEIQKIEMIIKDIQKSIDDKDEQQIYDTISQITMNIRNLMSDANHDKIAYSIIKFLNKIVATDPRIRTNACENLDKSLESGIDDINFEKQALLELRKYLKNSKKTKNYNNLPLSFGILVAILIMHNNRKNKISIEGDIWRCGINGIRYMPVAPTNSELYKLREPIEEGIQKLKR